MADIKVGSRHDTYNRRVAVVYVKTVLLNAKDWQEGQHAMADHPTIGPWLRGAYHDDDDRIPVIESIIRTAEDELGDRLPY